MSATIEIKQLGDRVKRMELILERFIPANSICRHQVKLEQAAKVEEIVSREHGLFPYQLHINTRRQDIVYPRQMAMWALRQLNWSQAEVGEFYDRDHGTVHHAEVEIQNRMETVPSMKAKCEAILLELKGALKI